MQIAQAFHVSFYVHHNELEHCFMHVHCNEFVIVHTISARWRTHKSDEKGLNVRSLVGHGFKLSND
jgi:hypothetical protein